MKKKVFLLILGLLSGVQSFAQKDTYLMKLTDGVKSIRQAKSSKDVLQKTLVDWSMKDMPKLTLMDEINTHANECTGRGVNHFKMNQLITYVYERQNVIVKSKDEYFNSTEPGIYYSAIEKSIPKGKTVTYTIKNHKGPQEFVFLAYNPKTQYTATVNGQKAEPQGDGVQYIRLDNVNVRDEIKVSISSASSNGGKYDSFVILNHNPQK